MKNESLDNRMKQLEDKVSKNQSINDERFKVASFHDFVSISCWKIKLASFKKVSQLKLSQEKWEIRNNNVK